MPDPVLREVIKASTLDLIPYYHKLPVEGGRLTYLTPEQYQAKFGCVYSESIFVDADRPALQVAKKYAKQPSYRLKSRILERLEKPRNDVAICYVNEKIGHVLIALQDIPLNPEDNEVLFLYAGVVTSTDLLRGEVDTYATQYNAQFVDKPEVKLILTSSAIGGLARFLPHLPVSKKRNEAHYRDKYSTPDKAYRMVLQEASEPFSLTMFKLQFNMTFIDRMVANFKRMYSNEEDEFPDYKCLDKKVEASIATENCILDAYELNGTSLNVMILQHPVKRGEILGFSYGRVYWESCNQTPELLYRHGQVVQHEAYKWEQPSLVYSADIIRRLSVPTLLASHIKVNLPYIETRQSSFKYIVELSVFDLRDKFVSVNALPEHYAALPGKSTFISRLEDAIDSYEAYVDGVNANNPYSSSSSCYPTRVSSSSHVSLAVRRGYTISSYFSTPWLLHDDSTGCEAAKVNAVVQTSSYAKQQKLWGFFQQQAFAKRCKLVHETREIIIEDINDGSHEIQHWDSSPKR